MSEQQNTQQPAWWHARINGAHDALFNELPPDDAYDEGTLTALYAAPPVPRDVLVAALDDLNEDFRKSFGCLMSGNYLAAIADRYASQVQPERCQCCGYLVTQSEHKGCLRAGRAAIQPEPVNQRLLAALKLAESVYRKNAVVEGEPSSVLSAMQVAIAAAEAAQPAVQDGVTIPRELFIQAMGWIEDRRRYGDEGTLHQVWCDLKAIQRTQQPASAQPVGVPDGYVLAPVDPTEEMLLAVLYAPAVPKGEETDYRVSFRRTYRAMLSASPKPEGGE